MKSTQRQFANKSSMLTLALLVIGGAVITTLVQAEDDVDTRPEPPGYLRPQLYRVAPPPPPSHNHWLLPTALEGRFEQGRYNIYFQDEYADLTTQSNPETDTRMSLSVGDLGSEQVLHASVHDRSMMSDWERAQYGVHGTVFTMSIGRRW